MRKESEAQTKDEVGLFPRFESFPHHLIASTHKYKYTKQIQIYKHNDRYKYKYKNRTRLDGFQCPLFLINSSSSDVIGKQSVGDTNKVFS